MILKMHVLKKERRYVVTNKEDKQKSQKYSPKVCISAEDIDLYLPYSGLSKNK